MGRRRVIHTDSLTTIHITSKSYDFIASQKKRHEPLYKTVERILEQYFLIADELSMIRDVYQKTLTEKLELQKQVQQ
jgi:molybdate-binding protein